jgi:hypothetical protein
MLRSRIGRGFIHNDHLYPVHGNGREVRPYYPGLGADTAAFVAHVLENREGRHVFILVNQTKILILNDRENVVRATVVAVPAGSRGESSLDAALKAGKVVHEQIQVKYGDDAKLPEQLQTAIDITAVAERIRSSPYQQELLSVAVNHLGAEIAEESQSFPAWELSLKGERTEIALVAEARALVGELIATDSAQAYPLYAKYYLQRLLDLTKSPEPTE